jgi:hypothetical protein
MRLLMVILTMLAAQKGQFIGIPTLKMFEVEPKISHT